MYYIDNLKKYISLVGLNEVIHIFFVIVPLYDAFFPMSTGRLA